MATKLELASFFRQHATDDGVFSDEKPNAPTSYGVALFLTGIWATVYDEARWLLDGNRDNLLRITYADDYGDTVKISFFHMYKRIKAVSINKYVTPFEFVLRVEEVVKYAKAWLDSKSSAELPNNWSEFITEQENLPDGDYYTEG